MAVWTRTGGDWTVTSTDDTTGTEIDPLYLLEVSFDDIDTPAQDRVWTDLGARLRSWNTEGGRDSELDDLDASRALLVLDTRDRELDPTNDASTLAPNVVPNRRIRLLAQTLGQTFPVFTGYVDGWGPSWLTTNYGDFLARVTATDGRKILSSFPLPASSPDVEEYPELVAANDPSFYYRMGEPQGTKLVGHKRIIRYKKGEKKGKRKRVKRWKTRETRATTEGVSGPSGTYKNTPALGQPGAIAGDSDTSVLYRSAQSEFSTIVLDVSETLDRDELTVMVWVKPTASGSAQCFVSGPVASGGGAVTWKVHADAQGHALVSARLSDGTTITASGNPVTNSTGLTGTAPVGLWTLLGFAFEGTNKSGGAATIALAVNGLLTDADDGAAATIAAAAATPTINIGRTTLGADYADAHIDEVLIVEANLHTPTYNPFSLLHAAAQLGFASMSTGTRISSVLDLVGEWDEWNIAPGTRTMPPARYAGLEPTLLIEEASEAEGVPSLFFFDRRNVPTLLPSDYRATAPYDAPLYEFGLDTGLISYEAVAVSDQDAFLYNVIRVSGEADETTVTVTSEDATSIARFGRRVLDVDGVMLTTAAELQALANTLLARHKDPMVRVTSFTLNGLDPAAREAALTLEIGDRVSVTIQPPGGGDPFVQESFVERRSLAHEEGEPLRATFSVSPR